MITGSFLKRYVGISRICRIAAFSGDGLVKYLLNLDKAINANAISATLKGLGQNGARKLQYLLLSKNTQWSGQSGLKSITMDAIGLNELYKERSISETCIEQVKGHAMAGSTLTDNFRANDKLWQLG